MLFCVILDPTDRLDRHTWQPFVMLIFRRASRPMGALFTSDGARTVRLLRGSNSVCIRLPIILHTLGRFYCVQPFLVLPPRRIDARVVIFIQRGDLSWNDVAGDNHASPHIVQIQLKTSKCDQYGLGADVIVGLTGADICPVSAMSQYLRI